MFYYQGLDYRMILFLYSYLQCCFCKIILIVLFNYYQYGERVERFIVFCLGVWVCEVLCLFFSFIDYG